MPCNLAQNYAGRQRAVGGRTGQRRGIVFANAAARGAGVRAGQAIATAQALCPHLCLLARDPAAEQQALGAFAALAWRYSSDIHLREPDAVLLEVGASLKLFDGWPALGSACATRSRAAVSPAASRPHRRPARRRCSRSPTTALH
ncbi:MAG: hypothetical protein KIS89_00360 [Dokdonella sp.]|nr:hypothetical protein [Dokdonella sp.]